jgi:tRNA dimethylallyltransferase
MSMPNDPSLPPVALIAGPTASGKSAIALALAEQADGVIINADASQVYADLSVLSARPSETEMARAPHRLFGHIDGATPCSAAEWAAQARLEVDAAHAAGRLPVLVGGTGLYIRTLLEGIAPVPDIAPSIRAAVRALPVAQAHAALSLEDAPAAARLNPADTSRVARALEVVRSTGRTLSDWQAKRVGGIGDRIALHPLILLPPREALIERCDARFLAMIESGAIAEVEALLARQLDPALPVMRAIGVAEIGAFLVGDIDHETMIARAQLATRRYAKRQRTWFLNQPPPEWSSFHHLIDDNNTAQIVTKLRLYGT